MTKEKSRSRWRRITVTGSDGHYTRTGYFASRRNVWSIDVVGAVGMPTHWAALGADRMTTTTSPLDQAIAETQKQLDAEAEGCWCPYCKRLRAVLETLEWVKETKAWSVAPPAPEE